MIEKSFEDVNEGVEQYIQDISTYLENNNVSVSGFNFLCLSFLLILVLIATKKMLEGLEHQSSLHTQSSFVPVTPSFDRHRSQNGATASNATVSANVTASQTTDPASAILIAFIGIPTGTGSAAGNISVGGTQIASFTSDWTSTPNVRVTSNL